MPANGSTTNRDEKELARCAAMVSVNTLDTGLANFRAIARKLLNDPKEGYHTRKIRLFKKALDAIDRALDHNERWAVQMALALTIGNVRDFVESEVAAPPGGFEVTVRETHTQTQTRSVRLAKPTQSITDPSGSQASPGPSTVRDPALPHERTVARRHPT